MGETEYHVQAILYLYQALRHFFRRAERIYAIANMLFYYEEGNPTAVVVPDAFVVKGIPKRLRRTYMLWEEKVAPCAVFEITSRSTRLDDLGGKRALYEMLGVREYFLFDPLDEYLSPRLQGWRLAGKSYQPIELSPEGALFSEELGLILRPEGVLLRLIDANTGEVLPTLDEAVDLAFAEMERAQIEAERAQAEAERAQIEAERAQAETERAQAEAERAQAEAERADAAEAEAARLRAELEQLRKQAGP